MTLDDVINAWIHSLKVAESRLLCATGLRGSFAPVSRHFGIEFGDGCLNLSDESAAEDKFPLAAPRRNQK
jgi:hypothetical protein